MSCQTSNNDEEILSYCEKIPKAELHAHLNGSVSRSTFGRITGSSSLSLSDEPLGLAAIFDVFADIHGALCRPGAIYEATTDVIKEFAADNVSYLELRTTPREIGGVMTRREYVEAVVSAIRDSTSNVKLLLSIDRRSSPEIAQLTVKMAEELRILNGIIVGVDLSGDPGAGDIRHFLPALECARKVGLKTAVHLGEIAAKEEENKEFLKAFLPDRIGHGTFLHLDEECCRIVRENSIPLELCLTSNVLSRTVSSFKSHHFGAWFSREHPCVVCTDDKGVFHTSLSKEYFLAAKNFNLTREDIRTLALDSLKYSFADDETIKTLRKNIVDFDK